MRDSREQRIALISYLESALSLAEELNEPAAAYLIERALDEARAKFWGGIGGLPIPNSSDREPRE